MRNNYVIRKLKNVILKERSIVEIDEINGTVKIIFSERYLKKNKLVQNNLAFDIDDFNDVKLDNQKRLTDIIRNLQNKNLVKKIDFKHKKIKPHSFYIHKVISLDRNTILIGAFSSLKDENLYGIDLYKDMPIGFAVLKMSYSKDNKLHDYDFVYANEKAHLFFDKEHMGLIDKKGSIVGHRLHERILQSMKKTILKNNKNEHSIYVNNKVDNTSHDMILKRIGEDLILLSIIDITDLNKRINQLKDKILYDKHTGIPHIDILFLSKNKQFKGILFFLSISNYKEVMVFNKKKDIIKEKKAIIKKIKTTYC